MTRLNQSYESLLQFSQLFLKNQGLSLASGNLETFAFAFDMNQLFERFIYRFFYRHRQEILPDALTNSQLLEKTRGKTRYLVNDSQNKGKFKLKPDLAIYHQDSYPILLDTKYKLLKPNDRNLGISSQDFYQMTAYAYRYHCPLVILLYPQTTEIEKPIREDFKIIDSEYFIRVATVDIRGNLSQPSERKKLIQELREILNI